MVLVVYLAGLLLFVIVFRFTRLSSSFCRVSAITQRAIQIIADCRLSDHDKENAAKIAGLQLLKLVTLITLKGALTFLCTLLPFWLADTLSLLPWEDAINFALRWDVLLITTVLMMAGWLFLRRKPSTNS